MSAQSEKLLRAIGEIDEELILDAAPLEVLPGKRRRRGVRWLAAAAIAAALLVGTAGAVTLVSQQAGVKYLDREQFTKEYNEYLEEHKKSPDGYSDGQYVGTDFTEWDAEGMAAWWEGPDGTLAEETAGTPEDGWTAKRVFKCRENRWNFPSLHGREYLETRYRAECVSGYNGLWDGWDVSWLEEHYTANPNGTFARTITRRDKVYFLAMGGQYRGDGDAKFNIEYSWSRDSVYQDEIRVSGNREYEELYTTPDGVELVVEMDASATGKSVFWVTLKGGHSSFGMFGIQMELEKVHDILDSLNLSKMLEYTPE